jgi:hypothetical protein
VSVGAVSSYTFTNVTANHTIDASFVINTYVITASAGPGGAISPNGAVNVTCGDDQSFTITPDACYSIADVLVDGVSIGAVSSYTFTNVTANHTIDASFVINTYTITASAGPGGAISPSGAVNVTCGDDQSFTITPDACYSIADVLVDGVSVGAVSSYTFTNVTANHTIDASFIVNTYTITASAGPGGAISPSGGVNVTCGDDQSFTITPDACYSIADVLVEGVSVGAVGSYTFTNVTANHTIDASFVINTYTITASAGPGGAISPSGAVNVTCGDDQSFTITPDACYSIADVLVDGVSVGAVSTYTFTNVTANHTIDASFVINTYSITATAGPGGAISPTGAVNVTCGDDQSFTITPDACYSIADVLVDGVSVGAVSSYTFTNVTANHTIDASFVVNTYTITASAGPGGAISPTGAVSVTCGDDQSFTITPDACYSIADVLVDGVSVGAVSSYTFTNVTANHTIDASFVINTYTITASAGPGGAISPTGAVNVTCGDDQSFTITPDACYSIADVLVDGVSVGAVSSYTFTNVTANHTIDASFIVNTYTITASAGPGGAISPSGAVSVTCGEDQSFTVTPDACYLIADVLVDGVSVGAVSSYTFTNVTANHTIDASFVLGSYTITASAGPGGAISPSGNVSVACGDDQSFTITPNACSHIVDVLVDGVSVGAVSSYTFNDVMANHTIDATFATTLYTITASAGPGGSISPNGAVSVACGDDQSFTITPDPCYLIADVLVDGVSVGAVSNYTFNDVMANHTIDASFVLGTYTITASAGPGGSITPGGAVSVNCGDDQTFTIAADPCRHIVDVLVDGVSVGAVSSYTFTDVMANHTISASFALTTYTITATAGAGGSIAPSGAVSVSCGANQGFTITPDPGFAVFDVLVDGSSVGPVGTYTFTGVSANHTIHATFIDTQDPSCQVLVPNGFETLIIGLPAPLTWLASDNDTVTCVKLRLSRNGIGGPWETIASCAPNTGVYLWTVTGPATNNAIFQIIVHDAAGNTCTDASDLPFRLVEVITPTLLSTFEALPLEEGVRLRWKLSEPEGYIASGIERSESPEAGWTAVEAPVTVSNGTSSLVDVSAMPGVTYWYRLSALTRSGQQVTFGAISVTAGAPITRFAMAPVLPNPVRGPAHVILSVPEAGRVHLSIFDVMGRERVVLADDVLAPGRYDFTWSGDTSEGRAPSGIYFVRAVGLGQNLVQRLVVVR